MTGSRLEELARCYQRPPLRCQGAGSLEAVTTFVEGNAMEAVPSQMQSAASGIIRAMHNVMRDVIGVAKDRKNSHYNFFFTGHDDVTEALRPHFVNHGIVQDVSIVGHERIQATRESKGKSTEDSIARVHVIITWTSVEDGTSKTVHTFGESSAAGTTADLQVGKAVSYAVKVAQLKTFMLLGGYQDSEVGAGAEEVWKAPSDARGGKAPSERPPGNPVSDEQVELLVSEYNAVSAKGDLDKLRVAVAAMLDRTSEEQYKRLNEADERAAGRVSGSK